MIDLGLTPTMNAIFAPILSLEPVLAIFVYSVIITFLVTLPYKFLVNVERLREIKRKVKELSNQIKEEQKKGNKEKANELLAESLRLNNEMMKHNMNPMLLGWFIIIIFLPWIGHQYGSVTIKLPFYLPIIGNVFPFNWIGWYFTVSITFNKVFRTLLGIDI